MKKTLKILLLTSLLVLALATANFAQDCGSKRVTLNNGSATLSGKTGGCNKFAFVIGEGQRVRVTLTSTDSKARFELQDGAEDETGSSVYGNLTTFNKVLTFAEFSIDVGGTNSTAFTLKITVSDE
jgi:hypothetical protein